MQNKVGNITAAVCLLTALFSISAVCTAQDKPVSPINSDRPTVQPNAAVPPNTNEKSQTAAAPTQIGMSENTRRYRIGINDELTVQVFRHPEYSQTVRVNEFGLILMPRVDEPIEAMCRTENELAAEIVKQYSKYLKTPYVQVFVKEYKSQPVAVIGAVDKPGQFNVNRKMRLLEAIAVAGGPTDKAGARISLARLGTANVCDNSQQTTAQVEEVDLSKLLYSYNLKKTLEGDTASNPWMQPGDIVTILEADKAFVVGNVKEPKPILLKTQRTLSQAIAEAGGILAATKKKEIFLVREDNAGNKQKIPINLTAISQGKAEDPILRPNDIIEVPIDGQKQAVNSIRQAFTNGIPSVLPFLF